ncbi:MAG: DMT family transporter [Chitinophagaceae bacterium]|nr:DMT family transporter [Chitinophagaceae bacterium]
MNEKFSQNKILVGAALAILATLIWSGNFIIARGSKNDIPPITLAFYRWLSATIILLPFTWHLFIKEIALLKKHFWYFLLTAVSGVTLFNTFVYIAGHTTEAINMALLGTTTSPIMSVILARIFLKESIPLTRVIGMLICISGILLLLSKGSIDTLLSFSFTKGDWWMLAAAFTFAVYNVCVRKKPVTMSSRNFLFTIFLIGTVLLLPFYLYELKTEGGFEFNIQNIGAIFYLGLGASVICFLLWNKSIANLGAGRASLFGNLIPVFSSIEAVLFLNEKVSLIHLYSFILVIAGLIIANLQIKSFIQVLNKK